VARQLTTLARITVAAPAYLDRFGRPETPGDLARHRQVGLRSITTGALAPFEFEPAGGEAIRLDDIAAPFSVTGTESYRDGVLLGLGLAQMPVFHVAHDLAEGRLERVLADWPVPSAPVSVLYPRSRQLSPRVRLFIDWAVQRFAAAA
jgi:DNA-binding transcriptional LysR family regulator